MPAIVLLKTKLLILAYKLLWKLMRPLGARFRESGDMTIGEQRVRISFNPSGNTEVEDIKRRAADAIDWCAGRMTKNSNPSNPEVDRCLALAMTHFEDAAMWAVKAVTTPALSAPTTSDSGTSAPSEPQASTGSPG